MTSALIIYQPFLKNDGNDRGSKNVTESTGLPRTALRCSFLAACSTSLLSIATLSPSYQCYQSRPYHRCINVIDRNLITVVSMLSIATLSLSYQCYRLQPYRCCINVIDCNLTPLYQCYRSQPYTVVSSLSIISVILINRDRHEHRWRAGAK